MDPIPCFSFEPRHSFQRNLVFASPRRNRVPLAVGRFLRSVRARRGGIPSRCAMCPVPQGQQGKFPPFFPPIGCAPRDAAFHLDQQSTQTHLRLYSLLLRCALEILRSCPTGSGFSSWWQSGWVYFPLSCPAQF